MNWMIQSNKTYLDGIVQSVDTLWQRYAKTWSKHSTRIMAAEYDMRVCAKDSQVHIQLILET
jgi:hypothetical protein